MVRGEPHPILMHSRMLTALALVLGASALLVPARPGAAQSTGVFTAAQAQAGAKLFSDNCSACHGDDLSGGAGPPLAGDTFMKKWEGNTAQDLYDVASQQMPLTSPGSLKPDEYIDLIAFILQKNGYQAGTTALDQSKLKSIPLKPQSGG